MAAGSAAARAEGGAAPAQRPVFQVTGLTVTFGGVRAVDDVSFGLTQGEILGIIGPNGAGKTTVFDAISGFVPSRGKMVLDGSEISELSPEQRARARLGRSFQDARLFPSLTVGEALAVAFERHLRIAGVVSTALRLPWVRRGERGVRTRVEQLIELMGLGAFRDKFVSELSTGSRRIVDLACILAHEPLVLLLDEPSSGIAQRETEALGPLLLRIREQTGASLLVIEHDMPLITSISDEIMALETGSLLVRGSPDEVLQDPRLVSAYLGTNRAMVERSGARTDEAEGSEAGANETGRKSVTPAAAGQVRSASTSPRSPRSSRSSGSSRSQAKPGAKASRPAGDAEPAAARRRTRSEVEGAEPIRPDAPAGGASEDAGDESDTPPAQPRSRRSRRSSSGG